MSMINIDLLLESFIETTTASVLRKAEDIVPGEARQVTQETAPVFFYD